MGTCDSVLNRFNKDIDKPKTKNLNGNGNLKNKGSNLFCAPIDSSLNQDNNYISSNNISQMTLTQDMSHYQEYQKPPIYKYVNKYKSNGLQRSIAKASLVELGGQGNSLVCSNIKNSGINQLNSLYTSRNDDTGYESSYDGVEMIIDGKMDEELVQKSSDKNTINNYNEFIKKKEDNKDNGVNGKTIMDYYKKGKKNKGLEVINEENKDGDDLSRISSGETKKFKNTNGKKNNINSGVMKYVESMGKY
jgi:hypothetical protein